MKVPIPDEQARRGHLALAERLGVDPETVTSAGFTVTSEDGIEARVTWTGIAVLPAQEAFDLLLGPGVVVS